MAGASVRAAGLWVAAGAGALAASPGPTEVETVRVYVGTYTDGESRGIYRFHLDLASGSLSPAGAPTPSRNPSYLALRPDGAFLYAVNEIGDFRGTRAGSVSAFRVDPGTGALELLNQESTKGSGPCHLTVDRDGRNVLVANYGGGSVAVLPIREDGRVGAATSFVQHSGRGANPERQEAPHAHSIQLDAANRFAFAVDLGLDEVLIYRYDPVAGTLAPHEPPAVRTAPGAGPRHFAFHPGGRHAYVINELHSTVTAFSYDPAAGALTGLQVVSTLPQGFTGTSSTAEVAVHPGGKLLYGSNRGHDSLAIFAIDAATGKLSPAGHEPTLGRKPRNFAIDPTGRYLLAANQDSDTLVVFRIDPESGDLAPVGSPVRVPRPVCVRMAPVRR